MVQKQNARPRGRPRKYEPEQALEQAMAAFWRNGYAATSLDDLTAATQMNRPSLYHAFGDKRQMYLSLLDRYIAEVDDAIRTELAANRPLKQALTRLYRRMLSMYVSPEGEARGCFLIGTAVTEAMGDAEVRAKLAGVLGAVTQALEERLRRAQAEGDLPPDADVRGLAAIAAAMLHSLAVQVRAGVARATLLGTAASAARLICGG